MLKHGPDIDSGLRLMASLIKLLSSKLLSENCKLAPQCFVEAVHAHLSTHCLHEPEITLISSMCNANLHMDAEGFNIPAWVDKADNSYCRHMDGFNKHLKSMRNGRWRTGIYILKNVAIEPIQKLDTASRLRLQLMLSTICMFYITCSADEPQTNLGPNDLMRVIRSVRDWISKSISPLWSI